MYYDSTRTTIGSLPTKCNHETLWWMMHQAPNITDIQLWHEANENQHLLNVMTQSNFLREVCIQMINMEAPMLSELIMFHITNQSISL